jgi:hypothetical protein
MNSPEQFDNTEKNEISENNLVEALRQDAESPEAKELLQAYCAQEEAKAAASKSELDQVRWNIKLGLIYAGAGFTENGLASLEWALTQARQLNNTELYDQIEDEIKKFKTP